MTLLLSLGIDAKRLGLLKTVTHEDIQADRLDGAVVLVTRRGTIILHDAFGYADRAINQPVQRDSVFLTMLIFKQMVNTAVLQRINRDEISFTSQVRELTPDYTANEKEVTTIKDLMLHNAGWPLSASRTAPEKIGDIQGVGSAVSGMVAQSLPEKSISYAAVLGDAVLAEIVRRLDGGNRTFDQILIEDLIEPLAMTDTSFGFELRDDQIVRAVPVVVKNRSPALLDAVMLEGAGKHAGTPGFEGPTGSAYTSAHDWFCFAEACRRGEKSTAHVI